MYSSGIEMSITCPRCDSSIIINGPSRKVRCNACQNFTEISIDFWIDIFKDSIEWIISDLKEGEGYNLMKFGEYNTKWSLYETKPHCSDCKKAYDLTNIDCSSTSIKCLECNKETSIIFSPDWLKKEFPAIIYFVNALVTEEEAEPTFPGGVAITCPRCGGSLIIDGKERLVPCSFCDIHVYLPDNLWLRLHPVLVKAMWFAVYNKEEADRIDFDE